MSKGKYSHLKLRKIEGMPVGARAAGSEYLSAIRIKLQLEAHPEQQPR
ncbi:hypothetical protein CAter282_2325 [Collimonas arenae]|uniref:Uncharacterized protein n=1 Tax=Collimonas arenae TaxID=279058 RepID=A0A127PQZ3_9BURK|nr:hypothetical protein CAter10_2557 [Collimonas arenae]AMP10075.1 hypothetical protein CAter282_2325 [Collimonas arenae]